MHIFDILARAEEEMNTTPKLTNQLFVPGPALNSLGDHENGPESLNAATFVSVVS